MIHKYDKILFKNPILKHDGWVDDGKKLANSRLSICKALGKTGDRMNFKGYANKEFLLIEVQDGNRETLSDYRVACGFTDDEAPIVFNGESYTLYIRQVSEDVYNKLYENANGISIPTLQALEMQAEKDRNNRKEYSEQDFPVVQDKELP